MRKIIYYCDKCGKEITEGYKVASINEHISELCPECSDNLADLFANWLEGKVQKTKKPAPNRVDIDMGKVHALMYAGWSLAKIGEEFRTTGQTIANRLKAEEAENEQD